MDAVLHTPPGLGLASPSLTQETLTEMQPRLAQAAIDTENLIKKVTADQLAADEQQAIVEKDVEEANKVAANVQVIKDDCQKVRPSVIFRARVCARVYGCDLLASIDHSNRLTNEKTSVAAGKKGISRSSQDPTGGLCVCVCVCVCAYSRI